MIKRCILFFILSLCVNSKRIDDIFNMDPDQIITSEVGEDFYEMRKRLDSLTVGNDTMSYKLSNQNDTNLNMNTTKGPDVSTTTTERIQAATQAPTTRKKIKYLNTTLREIKKRRVQLQLDKLLSTHRSVSDYLTDSDLDTLTRKVDQMIEENKINNNFPQETRRETYRDDDWPATYEAKTRYMNLMQHFTYITRYKLIYPQLLRKKYWENPQYRIGFLFALLRHLKNLQKWIFWKLTKHGDEIDGSIYFDLKMYERILRLDVDIKDCVLLIKKMEYHRNIQYNPKFYDYSLETYD
ncbi:hypothetical protein PYW08_013168 [Mythimna loreyi]|uniref:Uncharacterized protein n=1 Tax=Mythimna loreyi TaxID=667449 RepID=A0ACC2QET3_9NEOP|nr:hypothetical protein PYW08_013168 [Mythimna loreyi]